MFVRGVGRDAVGLAIHAAFSIGAETALLVTRVVLVIIRVAVVGVVVTRVLLSVGLRLRALTWLLGLLGRDPALPG